MLTYKYQIVLRRPNQCLIGIRFKYIKQHWLNIDSGLFTLCYETSNPNNGASSPFPRIRVL